MIQYIDMRVFRINESPMWRSPHSYNERGKRVVGDAACEMIGYTDSIELAKVFKYCGHQSNFPQTSSCELHLTIAR